MNKIYNPLEQFGLSNLFNYFNIIDLSINKILIFLIFALSSLILISFTNSILFNKLLKIIIDQFNFSPLISRHISLLLSLFFFLLLINLLGLIPFSYSITSNFIFVFVISFIFLFTILILSIINHKKHFIYLFIPNGVPKALLPVIILIEIFSYFTKFLSLPVRLFANIFAGHVILSITVGFISYLYAPILGAPIIIVLYIFEFGVSLIQSFVFILLLTIYWKSIWKLH